MNSSLGKCSEKKLSEKAGMGNWETGWKNDGNDQNVGNQGGNAGNHFPD